jgi:hypothetical protein
MAKLHDQDLDRLFRQAGHKEPVSDLTARIMSRVAVTPILRPTEVKPLIGKWGWAAILLSLAGFVGLLFAIAPAQGTSASPITDMIRALLNGARLPSLPTLPVLPDGNWPLWLAGASACVLLFTLLDRTLAQRLGGRQ